jgi:hypothetical protein
MSRSESVCATFGWRTRTEGPCVDAPWPSEGRLGRHFHAAMSRAAAARVVLEVGEEVGGELRL